MGLLGSSKDTDDADADLVKGVSGAPIADADDGLERDTGQRYEYCELNVSTNGSGHIERINKLAKYGWEVDERLTWSGTTHSLILRRPVE